MKKLFNLFIILSFICVVLVFIKIDYLILPKIHSLSLLSLSCTLLVCGFLSESWVWKITNHKIGMKISYRHAISSVGLAVFGKYIPGKIWLIVGRAAYLKNIYGFSLKQLSLSAIISQIMSLWIGLGVGITGLIFLKIPNSTKVISLALWTTGSIIILLPSIRTCVAHWIKKAPKLNIDFPNLSAIAIIQLTIAHAIRWTLFTLSYFLLLSSLIPDFPQWFTACAYPMGGTIGLMAFFIPGGIGVREAIITSFLTASSIPFDLAIGLSVASRVWYLFGEASIFGIGIILKTLPSK